MRFVRAAFLGIVGLVVGVTLSYAQEKGYAVQWHKLPPAPSGISEFLTISDFTLFVRAVDGSVLQYSDFRDQGWTQGQLPEDRAKWTEVTKPCDFSSSEFSFLNRPPNNTIACIQGSTQFIETRARETYLMDTEGNVWAWHYTASPIRLYEIYGSITCAVIGVLIGLSSLLIRHKKSLV